jgi:myo-inositol 2-dehydrogenase / D-chiro-inositol 1-dehydrogenase
VARTRTRIGIVGAGAVAARHADTLSGFEDVEIVGVTDTVPSAAGTLASATGARAVADLTALLDELTPDAVYLCVPPFAHGPPEHELVRRGVPFFVEKPLAAELATAEAVAAAVAERRLTTATGYHWRYLDGVGRVRALLEDRPARLAIASWLDKVPPPAWWLQVERSGGQVVEQVTHVLDVLVDLLGPVERVFAVGRRTARPAYPGADVDDASAAVLDFGSGAVGSVAATSLLAGKQRAGVELIGDGLRVVLTETELVIDDGAGPTTLADSGAAKRRVDRAFVDAVRGDGDGVLAPYDVALRTHRVACAIARSARDGVPVDL